MQISSSASDFRSWIIFLSFMTSILSIKTNGQRVSDKIYTRLQSNHYCSRRLNGTHAMGCSSELGGNLGVIWMVDKQDDLDHILRSGPTPPYVAILNRKHYTRNNLLNFKANPDRVSGAVFLDTDHVDSKHWSDPFSPDDVCPNRYSGLYVNDSRYGNCQHSWMSVSQISGLLYDDIPYPIFLINQTDSIEHLIQCFKENNLGDKTKQQTYPLCAIQLDSFMLAAGNSELCLNSHSSVDELLQTNGDRCNVVENYNIFGFLRPATGPLQPVQGTSFMKPDIAKKNSIVLIVAKLSSLSMFTEISPGADSTITSIVTLLAVAEALAFVKDRPIVEKSTRNIAFALLDSEPFDYTGSRRMVFDMTQELGYPNSYFPSNPNHTNSMQNINLNSVEYIINLDQMAMYHQSDDVGTAYLHFDPDELDREKTQTLRSKLESKSLSFKTILPPTPLPPSSLHQFIHESRHLKYENRLAGVVVSNYNQTYSNLKYNSIYDDKHYISQVSMKKLVDHVKHVATMVGRVAYELAFNADEKDSEDIKAEESTVNNLLECYLASADCPLFTKVLAAGSQLPPGPIQTFRDPIKNSDDMNGAITKELLAYFLRTELKNFNRTQCYTENTESREYNFQFINGQGEPSKDGSSGLCIRSQVSQTSARSPAYSVSETSVKVDMTYPAWTASLTGIRNPVRLFLIPSPVYQWCVFTLGLVITLASFFIVNHINKSILSSIENTEASTVTST